MAVVVAALLTLLITAAAPAQNMQAPWVDQADARIERHRMTDLRVIVVDAEGRPAPRAKVRVEQVRHDFPFGVVLDVADFEGGAQPGAARDDAPVWRCFNAVSLEQASAWPRVQAEPGQWDFTTVDDMLRWAERRGLVTRWGGLTSADPARVPQWLLALQGKDLAGAVEDHVRTVLVRYGRRVQQFDVHTQMFDHDLLASRLGEPMVRRLHEYAQAMGPDARRSIRFEDGLVGARLQRMIERVVEMREAFVPFDSVSVDQRFTGMILQSPLQKAVDALATLKIDVVVSNLEVSGPTPGAAAVNLEVVLRTLFADPTVRGIFLSGVTGGQFTDATAALLDDEGRPTPAGGVYEGLVRGRWWTDFTADADDLGNVQRRVMAGTYHLTALLPGGATAETTVYLPVSLETRVVLLTALAEKR